MFRRKSTGLKKMIGPRRIPSPTNTVLLGSTGEDGKEAENLYYSFTTGETVLRTIVPWIICNKIPNLG